MKIRPIFERIKKRFDIKNRRQVVGIFFLAWIMIGLCLYQQYGISLDERVERQNGMVSLIHIGNQFGISAIQNNVSLDAFRHFNLETYHDRIFGVFFSVTSAFFERVVFNIGDGWNEQAIFQFRHLETFLICVLGGYALFRISERRFGDWRIGLLTLSFFILSPRFFGESFYNNKDLIFLSFFFIGLNASIALLTKPRWLWAICAGLAAGVTVDIRVSGFILPAITLTLLLLQWLQGQIRLYKLLATISIYLVTLFAIVLAFWPWLWPDPLSRLLEAIQAFSRFTRSDTAMLFMGKQIRSTNLPWFYLPVWIGITTPVVYLLLMLIGGIQFISNYLKDSALHLQNKKLFFWSSLEQMQDLVFFSVGVLPILGVIILNSVAYDGWRHVYFVYPALLLIATKGWLTVWQASKKLKPIFSQTLITILTLSFISSGIWIARAHPLQNVYFNFLAAKPWKDNYEVDYWAVSARQALEYIAKYDERALIKVNMGSLIFFDEATKILKPKDKARFVEAEWEGSADYILTNYRPNPSNYRPTFTDFKGQTSGFKLWHEIKVDGQVISSIYRRQGDLPIIKVPSLGERIDFSQGGLGKSYLLDAGRAPLIGWGWSLPEPWGVWSDGDRARLAIPLPLGDNIAYGTLEIRLELVAYINSKHPIQMVQAWSKGEKIGEIEINTSKPQWWTLNLPSFSPRDGYALIEFRLLTPVSPKALGTSEDPRRLGIGLLAMAFESK